MKTTIRRTHFASLNAALRYYRQFCLARETYKGDRTQFTRLVVEQKIASGEIRIA